MKARYLTETAIGFFVMGLAIYLSLNLPNKNPSITIIGIFLIGLLGAFAPYIKINKSQSLKKLLRQTGKGLHFCAATTFCLGILGTVVSSSGLGILIGLMTAAFIYSIGSGLKSV